jgi:drug/metabolite transporter (DMT)-like permease
MALLPVLLLDRPWTLPTPSAATWGALLGLALLCTVLGYIVFFAIVGRAGATNVSLVTLLIPFSAILLGAMVLGERLEPHHLGGMTFILSGLAAADGRLLGSAAQRGPAKR